MPILTQVKAMFSAFIGRKNHAHTFEEVLGKLDDIVQKQFVDAQNKLDNRSHWGNVGLLVYFAAVCCRRIVTRFISVRNQEIDFDSMLMCLTMTRKTYSDTYPDEDGYGGATFSEVIVDLINLQTGLGIPSAHEFDSLKQLDFDTHGTVASYFSLSEEWGDFVDDLQAGDYASCYTHACFIIERSQMESNLRFAKRFQIMLFNKTDQQASIQALLTTSTKRDFESTLDHIAAGTLIVDNIGANALPPAKRARALYWGGELLRSRDDNDWRTYFEECAAINSDEIECVLAHALLGLPLTPVLCSGQPLHGRPRRFGAL